MLIKTVKLHNIRSYTSQTIDFSEGTTLLLGNIGSGKSTILQAIEFAIFGNQKGVIQASSLLRHGSNEGYITVTLAIDGKDVVIHRGLKRGKGVTQHTGYVEIDGVRHDGVVSELKSHIFSLLGYDENTKAKSLLFRYTVYTPQEEMKAIIFEPAEIRMDIIRKVFNIDKYKLIQENISLYQKELRVRKRVVEKSVSTYTDLLEKRSQIRQREKDILALIKDADKQLLTHDVTYKSAEKALQEAQKGLDAIKDVENKIALVETKIQSTQDKRNTLIIQSKDHQYTINNIDRNHATSTLRKQRFFTTYATLVKDFSLQDTDDVQIAFSELDSKFNAVQSEELETQKHNKELTQRYTKSTTMLASLKEKCTYLRERISQLQSECTKLGDDEKTKKAQLAKIPAVKDADIPSLKEQLTKVRAHLEQFMTKETQFSTKRSSIEGEVQSFSELDSCPLCKQDVPHAHKTDIVKGLKEKLVKIDENLTKIATNISVLKKKEASLQEQIDAAQQMQVRKAEHKQLTERVNELHKQLEEKGSALDDAKEQLVAQDQQLKQLEELTQKQEQALEESEKQMSRLTQQRQLLYDTRDDAKEIIAHVNNMQQEEERKKQSQEKVVHLKKEIAEVDAFIEQGNEQIVQLRKQIANSHAQEQYTVRHKEVERVRKLIEDTRVSLERHKSDLAHTKEQLNDATQAITAMDTEKKQLQKITATNTWFENYFVPLVQTIERKVLSFYKMEFEQCFADYFSRIIEDENMQVFIDDAFSPKILQNGYDVPVEDLSGGEKTSVSLAYRLALFKVINAFVDNAKTRDVLILDEPTDGFSNAQLDKLRDIFWDLRVMQLIIVSHESKLETFAQHFIRIEKMEHVSRII